MVPEKSKEKIVSSFYLDKKEPYDKAGAYAIQGTFKK